jgi:hypothetical protein
VSTQLVFDIEDNVLKPMNNQRVFDLKESTEKIRELKKQGDRYIIDVGLELLWVKRNIQHGRFLNWLVNEVDIHPRTAERYMKVAIQFIIDNGFDRKRHKGLSVDLAMRALASNPTLTTDIDREVLWGNNHKKQSQRIFLPVAKGSGYIYEMGDVLRLIFTFLRYLRGGFIVTGTEYWKRHMIKILRTLTAQIKVVITELEAEHIDEILTTKQLVSLERR